MMMSKAWCATCWTHGIQNCTLPEAAIATAEDSYESPIVSLSLSVVTSFLHSIQILRCACRTFGSLSVVCRLTDEFLNFLDKDRPCNLLFERACKLSNPDQAPEKREERTRKSLQLFAESLELCRETNPERHRIHYEYALASHFCFETDRTRNMIDNAIIQLKKADACWPAFEKQGQEYTNLQTNLGNIHLDRYSEFGQDLSDLGDALKAGASALSSCPPSARSERALALLLRGRAGCAQIISVKQLTPDRLNQPVDDLNEAIQLSSSVNDNTVTGACHYNLAITHNALYKETDDMKHLDEVIDHNTQADRLLEGHPDHGSCLFNLAQAYALKYQVEAKEKGYKDREVAQYLRNTWNLLKRVTDVGDAAVQADCAKLQAEIQEYNRKNTTILLSDTLRTSIPAAPFALGSMPTASSSEAVSPADAVYYETPSAPTAFVQHEMQIHYALSLLSRFKRDRTHSMIDDAINHLRAADDCWPFAEKSGVSYANFQINLGNAQLDRYLEVRQDAFDVRDALEAGTIAFYSYPFAALEERARALLLRGRAGCARIRSTKAPSPSYLDQPIDDLNNAIRFFDQKQSASFSGSCHYNLAVALILRYNATKDSAHLDDAIKHNNKAGELLLGDPDHGSCLFTLAQAYVRRFQIEVWDTASSDVVSSQSLYQAQRVVRLASRIGTDDVKQGCTKLQHMIELFLTALMDNDKDNNLSKHVGLETWTFLDPSLCNSYNDDAYPAESQCMGAAFHQQVNALCFCCCTSLLQIKSTIS
ncbi:hypothetical protein BJ165DRAFT_894264 [Panaeolus papilionaceus]|nr:hypothetical protein BJ165DRAFT_894264 [Panaeolus papilionaceus]